MQRVWRRYRLWLFYAAFLIMAMNYGGREPLLATPERMAAGKYLLLAIYVSFLVFSLDATARENFFRSIREINGLLWGRQVGIDLYISVALSLALIWLVEGSVLAVLLWSLPVLVFANLAILPYIMLNYSAIVGAFLG